MGVKKNGKRIPENLKLFPVMISVPTRSAMPDSGQALVGYRQRPCF
jgi:hypothetical protein